MSEKTPTRSTIQRFGEKLRLLRERHSLSQRELATMLGVTRNYISQFESGKRLPGTEMMLAIANIFGVSVDALVRDEFEIE